MLLSVFLLVLEMAGQMCAGYTALVCCQQEQTQIFHHELIHVDILTTLNHCVPCFCVYTMNNIVYIRNTVKCSATVNYKAKSNDFSESSHTGLLVAVECQNCEQ